MKVLIIIVFLMLCGCDDVQKANDRTDQAYKTIITKQMDACINQGGVPIMSAWNHTRMQDCKFKEADHADRR